MKNFITLLLFFALAKSFSQSEEQIRKYNELASKADSNYKQKKYKEAALNYVSAFKASGGAATEADIYKTAACWAMAGYADSSFKLLGKMAKYGFKNIEKIKEDEALKPLSSDKRWQPLLDSVQKNREKAEMNFDQPLVAELKKILEDDQKYRIRMDETEKKFGNQSPEMKKLWDSTSAVDNINLQKVKKILDERGWLGTDIVGEDGNMTLFLVIQHADPKTQEKYLPVLRQAVKDKKARPSELALLEDRVALAQGKKQIYGSQLQLNTEGKYVFSPIEDEANVNKRRSEVGLEPIEQYAKQFGITYRPGQSTEENEDDFWSYLMWGAVIVFVAFLLIKYVLPASKKVEENQ